MRVVTYSKNVFIPVTNMCRNHCGYCGFRRSPDDPQAYIMQPVRIEEILKGGVQSGCTEALFTFGERPDEDAGYLRQLKAIGYDRTLDYLLDLCRMAIKVGLLPHCNPGVLSYTELALLKPLNASMGLMLETTAHLQAHEDSPGKVPEKRIESIANAGKLKIPFTTGLLVGIGETGDDRVKSIELIARMHWKYGHIQEVIIQNFTPKPGTAMEHHPPPKIDEMIRTVELAREILPDDVAVQVPPNLISPRVLIEHGATDLGGISPVTIDHINPEHEWPAVEQLEQKVGRDVDLRERLPIYPQYIKQGWFSEEIRSLIQHLAGDDGYRKVKKWLS
ncbi:MAG: 7,8-didemethyl-8-hydroxy-5-deazariboflavin synthase subunit CofG [Methanosarcinales archaeon]|nr:7,8-didemethyl-8-hydroxy-5-deazariboflavin synthase subunit CofG [Methanosarcinales archaeon]